MKLTRDQVKEILEAAGWAWDESRSIPGEENRKDCENLVNEAYRRGVDSQKRNDELSFKAIQELNDLPYSDPEGAHSQADYLLLEFLKSIGYGDVAEAWESSCDVIGFWYA